MEFLGVENMLAIICGSRSAAECVGIPHIGGAVNKSKGLSGFARSHNLRISGRYRVITLIDESSFYKCADGSPAVKESHPQKLLNIGPVIKPGSERLVGSLGYAVNMITLTEEQLRIRVAGCGLRESLFFMLFGYLEVFDTTNNMIRARKNIRTTAVSLDGGLIRARNQFELGSREDPVVWFPAVQRNDTSTTQKSKVGPDLHTQNIVAKQNQVKKTMLIASQRYREGGTEDDIRKVSAQLRATNLKIAEVKQMIISASQNVTTKPVSRPPGSKY